MSKSHKKFPSRPKVAFKREVSTKNKLRSVKSQINDNNDTFYEELHLEDLEDDNFEKFTKKRWNICAYF